MEHTNTNSKALILFCDQTGKLDTSTAHGRVDLILLIIITNSSTALHSSSSYSLSGDPHMKNTGRSQCASGINLDTVIYENGSESI
jgi:hypothetical protein